MSEYETRPSGGTDTTDVARQEGRRMQGTAKDAASSVGDTATARGQQLKGQARQHARGVADDARRQLRGHAQEETQRAGTALGTAGDQLRALADGRVDEAGVLRDYIQTAADTVGHWADTVQDRGLDGLLDDLRSFGRRRPGLFLAGALAAGVVAGRFGRNAAQELGDEPAGGGGAGDRSGAGQRDTSTGQSRDPSSNPSSGQPRGASDGDDMIVGYASDDSAVVVGPGGTTAEQTSDERPVAPPRDADEVEYQSIDVDRERAR